jgi:hypothetical protein
MELERLLRSSVAAAAGAAAGRGCWPGGMGRTGRSRRSGFRTMPVSAEKCLASSSSDTHTHRDNAIQSLVQFDNAR